MPSRDRRVPALENPVVCSKCRVATFRVAEPTALDASFAELQNAGWLDRARKGMGRDRWAWECPACRPTGKPAGPGLSTGHFMPPKS